MKSRNGLWIVLSLVFVGMILGSLGTWSVPLGHGFSAFWPAFVVQVAGGIWFGGWGVLAGVIFPVFTNALTGVGVSGVLGFIPANLAQGLIPAWAFRHFRFEPAIPGRKGLAFYLVWGALIPATAGGLLGSAAVVLFGEASWSGYPLLVATWSAPHIVVSLFIGIPVLRELTPLWRDFGVLPKGWWAIPRGRSAPRRFSDMSIQLKLFLALGAAGLGPLFFMAAVELAQNRGNAAGENLTPLFLAVGLVAMVVAVGFLSRETVRPLRELQKQVEALVRSRDGVLTVERDDEIGQLGRAFATLLEELRRVADERQHMAERLAESDQLKDQFIRMAAHELKTPVTIVKGYSQAALLPAGAETPALRSKLEAIDRGADRITRIVNDMLEVTQARFGKLKFQNLPFDLPALVSEVTGQLALTVGARHNLRFLAGDAATVMGDSARIEQVLTNLIGNALTYTQAGSDTEIAVSVRSEGSMAVVSVQDQGIGIAKAQQGRLFEPFFRAHAETKHDFGGMGIGLFLSREFVIAQGGSIGFSSEEGKGSTFFFRLPLVPGVVA